MRTLHTVFITWTHVSLQNINEKPLFLVVTFEQRISEFFLQRCIFQCWENRHYFSFTLSFIDIFLCKSQFFTLLLCQQCLMDESNFQASISTRREPNLKGKCLLLSQVRDSIQELFSLVTIFTPISLNCQISSSFLVGTLLRLLETSNGYLRI